MQIILIYFLLYFLKLLLIIYFDKVPLLFKVIYLLEFTLTHAMKTFITHPSIPSTNYFIWEMHVCRYDRLSYKKNSVSAPLHLRCIYKSLLNLPISRAKLESHRKHSQTVQWNISLVGVCECLKFNLSKWECDGLGETSCFIQWNENGMHLPVSLRIFELHLKVDL